MDRIKQFKRILSAITVVTLTTCWPNIGFAAPSCPASISPDVQKQIATNNFEKNRSLDDYANHLTAMSTTFYILLADLPQGAIVVDMGAGTARALKQMLEHYPQIGLGVGISHTRPTAYVEPTHLESRFQYIDGDYVENMAKQGKLNHLVGKVKMITDFFGPFSYSADLVPLLQAYVDLLQPGGRAFIHFSEKKNIVKKGNQEISLIEWLKTIPGVHVSRQSSVGMGHGSVIITKVAENVVIPARLVPKKHQFNGGLPNREFDYK